MTINILNGATLDFDNAVKIRSATATGSGDVNVYVGSTLLDGSLSTGVKLLSVGTGLNPTNTLGYVEKAYIDAAGNFHSANVSGTNTGDQTTTLTGDVTGTGMNTVATTIANGVVTLAKTGGLTGPTVLGRSTAGAGSFEALSLGAGLTLSGAVLNVNTTNITLGTMITGQLLSDNMYVTNTSLGATGISLTVTEGAAIGGYGGTHATLLSATGYVATTGMHVADTYPAGVYGTYTDTPGLLRASDILADTSFRALNATIHDGVTADHFVSTMTTPTDSSGSTTITQNAVKGRFTMNAGVSSVTVNNSFVNNNSVVLLVPPTTSSGFTASTVSPGQFVASRSASAVGAVFSYVVL